MDKVKITKFEKFGLYILFLFLFSEVTGGALRYYFDKLGFTIIIYLPKILLLLVIIFTPIYYILRRGKSSFLVIFFIALFITTSSFAIINISHLQQIGFGLWVWVPFLAGVVLAPSMLRIWYNIHPYIFLLWSISFIGVLANYFIEWPWLGYEYTIAGNTVKSSYLWWTGGYLRLSGFARSSFDVAIQILIFSLILFFSSRRIRGFFIWILSGIAIFLTTNKTAFGVQLFLTVAILVRKFIPRITWMIIPILIGGIGLILPFSTLTTSYAISKNIDTPLESLIFFSFGERLEKMWPQTIDMLLEQGSKLFGRGIGGIGIAQNYFESQLYSPADNMSLYLFGVFGLFGLFLIILYMISMARYAQISAEKQIFYWFGCIVLLEGWTINVIESPILSLIFGFTFYIYISPLIRSLSKIRRDVAPTTAFGINKGIKMDSHETDIG